MRPKDLSQERLGNRELAQECRDLEHRSFTEGLGRERSRAEQSRYPLPTPASVWGPDECVLSPRGGALSEERNHFLALRTQSSAPTGQNRADEEKV